MNINQAASFVNNLKKIGQKGYITSENNQFKIITNKKEKKLKTQDIAKIAQSSFDCYQTQKLSIGKKMHLMGELKGAINVYNARVWRSKNFFQKIGFYLGCRKQGEKDLQRTLHQIVMQERSLGRHLRAFNNIEREIDQRGKNELERPEKVMVQFNRKVLEGTSFRDKSLDLGFDRALGMQSYLNDLVEFSRPLKDERYGKTIEALTFALSIANLQTSQFYKNPMLGVNLTRADILTECKLRIFERIQDLKEKGNVGDQIILPGGYSSKDGTEGHGVIYQIIKTSPNTCSLTIVNTGAGAEITISLSNAFDWFFKDRISVDDITYTHVNFNRFSLDFIEKLQSEESDLNGTKAMKAVIKKFDTYLGIDHKGKGRTHRARTKGSCAFKSVSSWMKESLGEANYNCFKSYLTRKEIERLSKVKAQNPELIDQMLALGQKVLDKRVTKAKN